MQFQFISLHRTGQQQVFTNGLIDALGLKRGLFWGGFPYSDSFTQPDTPEWQLWV